MDRDIQQALEDLEDARIKLIAVSAHLNGKNEQAWRRVEDARQAVRDTIVLVQRGARDGD